ncbi:unnamed protein product, partial [Scytosiphon promiscuus]
AVCPGLGLLAHLDGSTVRLLQFPRHCRADSDGVVAEIDLEASRRSSKPDPSGGKQGSATPSEGLARGLSWAKCEHSAAATTAAAANPNGSSPWNGGSIAPDGDKVCHIAVACGPEALLWRVSRVPCRQQTPSAAGAGERGGGAKQRREYQYSAVQVRTGWHAPEEGDDKGGGRCGGDNPGNTSVHQEPGGDGVSSKDKTPAPAKACDNGAAQDLSPLGGDVRCLSFRPCAGGRVGAPAAMASGDGTIPLAAWYDTGATVLGSGGTRVVLPAPVRRKRACGAWSGCGRRLALSSGGEIRVYTEPWGNRSPSAARVAPGEGVNSEEKDAPGSHPAKKRNAWLAAENPVVIGGDRDDALPVAIGVRESEVWQKPPTATTDRSGAEDVGGTFRTVLCVEAAVYEGGVLSSPGSSPGGTPRPLSPKRNLASLRHGGVDGAESDVVGKGLPPPSTTAVPAAATETRNGSKLDGERKPSSSRTRPSSSHASATGTSLSKLVLGDMRAMCAAGPLAFFGATDGGLGLGSVLAASGTAEASGAFLTGGSDRGGAKRGGDDLLGAIVGTTNTARADEPNAVGGGSVDVSARRSGFRHVLPGENWLAGSLRPSLRALRPDSPPTQRDPRSRAAPERVPTTPESAPVVSAAAGNPIEGENVSERASSAGPRSISMSATPSSGAAPDVLDLRGKLGGGIFGGGDGVIEGAATRTSASPTVRSSVSSRSDGSNTCGTSNSTSRGAGAPPGRGPWLVRASCRSSGVSVKALAPLPPGLASPDLIASSEDGHFVAVGGHACDLVACYHLERQSSSGAEEHAPDSPGKDSAGSGGQGSPTDRIAARRQKRRQRRAVPLCTLRLPVGYRAKGLTFVGHGQLSGSDGAAAMSTNTGVAGHSVAEGGGAAARKVTVLVLAGCGVSDANSVPGDSRRPGQLGASLPGDSRRRGARRSSAEASYRTVVLTFSLPSGGPTGDGQDVTTSAPARSMSTRRKSAVLIGDRKSPEHSCMRDGAETIFEDKTKNDDKKLPAFSGSAAASIGSGPGSSTPGGIDGGEDTGDARIARLETAVLQAVAGVERRLDERFNQMERVLGGVCDRLEALES